MSEQLTKVLPFLRIFFPEQRKWVARVFIVCGLPLVAGQVWEPYANALLSKYLEVRVTVEAATYTGWALLIIGMIVFVVNEVLDRLPKRLVVTAEDTADRQSLIALFSQIHTPSLDLFFHYGKLSMTYYPVLHYFYGIEGFVQASRFHIHDVNLKTTIEALYSSLAKALSFGEFFSQTANPDLYKFDSRHDIHMTPRAKEAHDTFIAAIYAAEGHLRTLCEQTSKKFPDFDFAATNTAAAENYRSYHAQTEA